jgi:hypothetical protein
MLFIQPRHMIVAEGDKDLVDVFLINENNLTGPQTLKFTARRPDGSVAFTTEKSVVAAGGDTYGQLLADAIELPPADVAGMMTLTATLTPQGTQAPSLTRNDQIEVVDVAGAPIFQNIAVLEPDQEVASTLQDVFHVTPMKLSETPASKRLDAIILAPKSAKKELAKAGPATNSAVREVSKEIFKDALDRVYNDGTRLILWPDNNFGAAAFAKELASLNIVKYSGTVGNLNAPWFGSWFFTRKHWLLEGLPADCAMDWRYGISAFHGPEWLKEDPKGSNPDGLLLDAPGLEAVVGFGADHNPKVGISGCIIPHGKGQIVLCCLPQQVRSLQSGKFAISPVICQRLLGNALRPVSNGVLVSSQPLKR